MRTFFREALKRKNIIFQEHVKTADLCTFRIGGACRYLIEPQCIGELVEAILLCEHEGIPYEVIGGGSTAPEFVWQISTDTKDNPLVTKGKADTSIEILQSARNS